MSGALEKKLVAWFTQPAVQALRLQPAIFWHPEGNHSFGHLKVDAAELEVYLAALLGEPSECHAAVEAAEPGRARFLAGNARRHELPLFKRSLN